MNTENIIPFTDDFIFSHVMQHPEICKGILERVLPDEEFSDIKIIPNENSIISDSPIAVETQKSIRLDSNSHGVRFDAYIQSADLWADIEMQTYSNEDIGKRSRYYHGNMDIDFLAAGKPYKTLKKSYVIFICTFDFKKMGEPVYHFQNYDIFAGTDLEDGAYTLVLNTACPLEKVPDKLRPLYAYINDPASCDDAFIRELDSCVRKYNGPEWRTKHMTLDYIKDREKEIGKEIGQESERNRFNALITLLTEAGRLNDLSEAAKNPEFQNNLFAEFNL